MTPQAIKTAARELYRLDHADAEGRQAYITTVPHAYGRVYLAMAARAIGRKSLTAQGKTMRGGPVYDTLKAGE